jgi:hypothetical protein
MLQVVACLSSWKLGLPVLLVVGRYYFVPRMCKKTPLYRFLPVLVVVVPTNDLLLDILGLINCFDNQSKKLTKTNWF